MRISDWISDVCSSDLVMAAELVLLTIEQQWVHVFLVAGIMLTMAMPVVLKARFSVQIPPEVQILAILFGFAALFLGEVRDYYERFWWWDLILHATADRKSTRLNSSH